MIIDHDESFDHTCLTCLKDENQRWIQKTQK